MRRASARLRSFRRRGLDPFGFARSLSSAERRPAERRPPRPLQELCQAPAATSRCPRTVTLLEDAAPGPGRGAERGRSGPFTVVARPAIPLALQPTRGPLEDDAARRRRANGEHSKSMRAPPTRLLFCRRLSHLRLRSVRVAAVPSDSRVASLPPNQTSAGDGATSRRDHIRGVVCEEESRPRVTRRASCHSSATRYRSSFVRLEPEPAWWRVASRFDYTFDLDYKLVSAGATARLSRPPGIFRF